LKASKKVEEQRLNISDAATKEFVETLRNEAELDSDWEVVHPDVPLNANEECVGKFSVCGSEWRNQDTCEVIINPIGKWWKAAKHSVAWRLLNIAQTGSQPERLKAVQQLICMDHLKDWDFRHLAQICDARTAVSLARCNADTRWFMPVHRRGCIKNPKMLLSELHVMLARLRPMSCVDHFFSKYFPEQDTIVSLLLSRFVLLY